MPERESDKRRQQSQELQERLDQWDKDLLDSEWCERLVENLDWNKLCKVFDEGLQVEREQVKIIEDNLFEAPMGSEGTMKAKEAVMLMRRDLKVAKDFMEFPKRELERLNKIRSEYPKAREEMNRLNKRETSNV